MAYAFTATNTSRTIDNHRHISYVVTQTDVATTSEWYVDVPSDRPVRLTTFECEITDADDATTVQPELGLAAGWTVDGIAHLVQQEAAAARVRNDSDIRFMARNGKLYGRSQADDHANTIVTRFTIVEGN